MAAEILAPRSAGAQPRGREPRLGVASTLLALATAPSSGSSRSTRPRSRSCTPAAAPACAWATSSATSSTATASSSSSPSAGAPRSRARPTRSSSSTATTRSSASRDGSGAEANVRPRRSAPCEGVPSARGRLEVLPPLRYALRVRRRLRRPSRRLPLSEWATGGRRWRFRPARSSPGARPRRVHSCHAGGRGASLPSPGSTTSTTRSRRRPSHARWASAGRDRRRASRFSAAFGRFERIQVGDRSVLLLLIKNPAGANEAVRTLVAGEPAARRVALNERSPTGGTCPGSGTSTSSRSLAGLETLVVSGGRAAERRCASSTAASPRDAIEVVPASRPPSTAGWSSRLPEASSRSSPPTPRCSRCDGSSPRGSRLELLGERGVKITVGDPHPEYLNIYADRGNIAVLAQRAARRGHALEVRAIGIARPRPVRRDRPVLRGRRPGSRAGARRPRSRRQGGGPARGGRPEAPRSSLSAAATNCSDARTGTSQATSCRASACCRCRPSRASGA